MAFTIPTIFEAIDKMTSPVQKMQRSVDQFTSKINSGIEKGERLFKKFTPALSEAGKQFLSFASSATLVAGIVGGISFSAKSIVDYEGALKSFRVIVGGTDEQFSKYQDKINEVARDTKKSSVETAAAFEKIAGLNAKFAETADGIGTVSKAVITLSKASGEELASSAESLVGIMNQFSMQADQSNRVINVLAAGAGVGAASIKQTSEAFVNFGSVAAGANISLEQSVGLIQTMGKFSLFGAEAGTKLRGSILKLQQAGMGYKSGQFQINDALEEARKKLDKLKTAKQQDAAILKMFGAENISTGKILVNNIKTIEDFTKGVTGTNAATEQAAIRSNTLMSALDELKAGWVNMLTGSSMATEGLENVKAAVRFVTDNLGKIVQWGVRVLAFFAAWKAALIGARIAMFAYNTVYGIQNALLKKSIFFVEGNTVAKNADLVTTKAVTAATWLWNAALSANPIMMVVLAVAALTAGLALLSSRHQQLIEQYRREMEMRQAKAIQEEQMAVDNLTRSYMQLGLSKRDAMLKSIAFERQNIKLEEMKVAEKIAANKRTIKDYSLVGGTGKGGIFGTFSEEKKKAEEELVKNSQRLNDLAQKNLSLTKYASDAVGSGALERKDFTGIFNKAVTPTGQKVLSPEEMNRKAVEENRVQKLYQLQQEGMKSAVKTPSQPAKKEAVNSEEAYRNSYYERLFSNTNNAKVEINVKDDTGKTETKSDQKFVTVKTTSTMKK